MVRREFVSGRASCKAQIHRLSLSRVAFSPNSLPFSFAGCLSISLLAKREPKLLQRETKSIFGLYPAVSFPHRLVPTIAMSDSGIIGCLTNFVHGVGFGFGKIRYIKPKVAAWLVQARDTDPTFPISEFWIAADLNCSENLWTDNQCNRR